LSDWPGEATWLSPEQWRLISQELQGEKHISEHAITVWHALKSPTIILLARQAVPNYFVFYTFAFWFPTTGIIDW
jgi:hypothetical protein